MAVGLSVFYPASHECQAALVLARLCRLGALRPILIPSSGETFDEDLADACASEDALLILLAQDLIPIGRPARAIYAPLLCRLEGQAPTAIVTIETMQLPPLLARAQRAVWADSPIAALRQIEAWAVARLPRQLERSLPAPETLAPIEASIVDSLFDRLIDGSDSISISTSAPDFAHQFAILARPHFETIHLVEMRQQAPALLNAALATIIPNGRALWILIGYKGAPVEAPAHASILALPDVEALPALEPYALLRATPVIEGEALPFSTFEFERTLPALFNSNGPLAERVARKAGAFFRVNHRTAEAIWLYELLEKAARSSECAAECANELYWLRAGGERKALFFDASQASFNFNS